MGKYILMLIFAVGSMLFTGGCMEGFLPGANRTTTGNIQVYKERLEKRLLHQYKNHPVYGNKVAKVELDVVKDIKSDVNNKLRKVEFSQLVYDNWKNRIPELEKEYFVITFGPKSMSRARIKKRRISVGLDAKSTYSEYMQVESGDIGRLRRKESTSRGIFCPLCGRKVSETGICPECSGMNVNKKKISKNNGNYLPSTTRQEQERLFTEEVTRKVRSNLKWKELRSRSRGENSYGDLQTQPYVEGDTYRFNLGKKSRLGGTENLPAGTLPKNEVLRNEENQQYKNKRYLNNLRKNIDQQVIKKSIKSVDRSNLPVEREDRDFGVLDIESRSKAEIMR